MHYMLPPEKRLIGAQLGRYVRDQLYWVLHAPRQTGKTTFLLDWQRQLNAGGAVIALYVSIETCQEIDNVAEAMKMASLSVQAEMERIGYSDPIPSDGAPETILTDTLRKAAKMAAPKPLVVLFDEVDVLRDQPMVQFLRVLRSGFATRGVGQFPTSIALVALRDLKDYIIRAKDGKSVNPGSPFNIKEDSAVIGNFSREDAAALFAQHTAETGQRIADNALNYVWEQSRGQPWIVNNLFKRATMRVLDEDSTETVSLAHVKEARRQMVEARETHLDSLEERLRDPRVKRVIEAVITGDAERPLSPFDHDVELTQDLGLIRYDNEKGFVIANPVYEELMVRFLDIRYKNFSPAPSSWRWQKADGTDGHLG
jgi:hypothetical protein